MLCSTIVVSGAWAATHKAADDIFDGTPIAEVDPESLAKPELDEDPGDPTNYLIVGSDSRSGQGDDSGDRFGDVGGQRSDAIMVIHVIPREKRAIALSFPRDLVVEIPGMGTEMINSAYNTDRGGGPDLLVRTITQNFGIPINHYLGVDFAGFESIVNAIGYVDIYFPAPAYDRYTGLSVMYYGCGHLDGTQALNYARSRHYHYYDFEDEEWKSDPTSDFGRIRRQQYFLRSLMQRALERTSRQPFKAVDLAGRLADLVERDPNLRIDDVTKIAKVFAKADPAAIEMLTVPVQSGGGGLVLRADEAQPLFDRFRLEPAVPVTVDVDYSKFTIDVLNANAETGAAQVAMGELAALGFGRGLVGDAQSVTRTELRYATEEGRAAAAFVQLFLGGVGVPVEVDDLGSDADVVLVLGPDFDAVRDPGVDAGTTTSSPSSVPGGAGPDPTTEAPETTIAPTTTTIAPNPGTPPADSTDPIGDQRVGCSPFE